jgi:hypothetical protein
MTFIKGQPRPANAGRKKGSPKSQTRADIKAALAMHAPEMVAELVRLTRYAKNEMTRVAAIRECFDRVLGKASQPVEGQLLFGVSADLQRLLEQHDGNSRSIPRYAGMLSADVSEEEKQDRSAANLNAQSSAMQPNGSAIDISPHEGDVDVQEAQQNVELLTSET